MTYELPRLFVASSADTAEVSQAPVAASWVIDRLVIAGPDFGADGREVIVGLDALGGLALRSAEGQGDPDGDGALLSSMRAHLAHAEITSQRRRVACASADGSGLWLMAIELFEQLPDAPGVNDAVYLYGTLYPAWDAAVPGIRGQLTTTRADVLRGFVDGFDWAFRYPPDESERVPRACHLLLPGDRPERLGEGRGLVLAYPLVDPALLGDHAGSDLALTSVLHDLLAALRTDLGVAHPSPLPVPDRAAALEALRADGWEIHEHDDVARRKPDSGFFGRLFADREEVALPAQATLERYAALARDALAKIPGWPSPTSRALFSRVGNAGPIRATLAARAAPRAPAPTPRPHPRPRPRPPPHPHARPHARARSPEWMRDFLDQHAAHSPQLTPLRRPPSPSPSPSPSSPPSSTPRPDWMRDFD